MSESTLYLRPDVIGHIRSSLHHMIPINSFTNSYRPEAG